MVLQGPGQGLGRSYGATGLEGLGFLKGFRVKGLGFRAFFQIPGREMRSFGL